MDDICFWGLRTPSKPRDGAYKPGFSDFEDYCCVRLDPPDELVEYFFSATVSEAAAGNFVPRSLRIKFSQQTQGSQKALRRSPAGCRIRP
ncbi:hypothetical protein [Microcoleus sp. CZ3-B4]|uniref:hypothetical protein n=1 Tax=Microcoleus sp. CZ3-B4 TaxID=2818733 RepID=UPI002FD78041